MNRLAFCLRLLSSACRDPMEMVMCSKYQAALGNRQYDQLDRGLWYLEGETFTFVTDFAVNMLVLSVAFSPSALPLKTVSSSESYLAYTVHLYVGRHTETDHTDHGWGSYAQLEESKQTKKLLFSFISYNSMYICWYFPSCAQIFEIFEAFQEMPTVLAYQLSYCLSYLLFRQNSTDCSWVWDEALPQIKLKVWSQMTFQ